MSVTFEGKEYKVYCNSTYGKLQEQHEEFLRSQGITDFYGPFRSKEFFFSEYKSFGQSRNINKRIVNIDGINYTDYS